MIKSEVIDNLICKSKKGLIVVSSLLLLVSSSFSQRNEINSTQQKLDEAKQEVLKWKTISEKLTKDIIDDTKVDYAERPLILAKLAKLWQKNDEVSAKKWLKTAVNEVTFDSLTETDTKRTKRMEVAAKLIKLVMPKDKKLGNELIEYISTKSSQPSSNSQNADELVKTALQIVDKNPVSAKMLGTLSLKHGQSYSLFLLIRELNLKDARLAENLFSEALLSAKRNRETATTVGLISSLYNVVFRKYKGKSLSENARKNYLNVLFNLVSIETNLSCSFLPIASGLITSYENYFPEKVLAIRQRLNSCSTLDKSITSSVNTNLSNKHPKTVEEFIAAAKEAKDNFLKSTYYRQAIKKLYNSKNFERILSILEDINNEDKKAFGEDGWNSWWVESALKACVIHIKNDNLAGAYRIINKTPKEIRPNVQSGLAKEFQKIDRTFAIQMLDDARKSLDAFEIESKKRASLLLYLIKQYAEIAPYEIMDVFRDTIKAVNKTDTENPKNERINDYSPFRESILLPISIIENEELTTMEILSNIVSRNSRIRFRLGFLEQSLKKFDKAKDKAKKISEENA